MRNIVSQMATWSTCLHGNSGYNTTAASTGPSALLEQMDSPLETYNPEGGPLRNLAGCRYKWEHGQLQRSEIIIKAAMMVGFVNGECTFVDSLNPNSETYAPRNI